MAFLQSHETLAGKIGLLNYAGMTGKSLARQACPPHRGVIMVTFQTDDLRELERRLRSGGAEIIAADVETQGRRWLTARAPDGLFMEFFA
jgi:predicted enzyme related to lactoylglutathione lyase